MQTGRHDYRGFPIKSTSTDVKPKMQAFIEQPRGYESENSAGCSTAVYRLVGRDYIKTQGKL